MYRAMTHKIQVTVGPRYLEDESSPDAGRFFWAYRVEIVNLSEQSVTLRTRTWRITDANGHTQEVRGIGVVGEQPVIPPGRAYSYTSGAPLSTSSGIMVGSYQMETEAGEMLNVDIPAFSLDCPYSKRRLN